MDTTAHISSGSISASEPGEDAERPAGPSDVASPHTERPSASRAVPAVSEPPVSSGPSLDARYEDLGRIARGGMGEVRRVLDRQMNRVLAMKILPWEMLDEERDRARFLAEAHVTAALQHPGIVPVHDCGELPDGRIWFTMKEVRGRTLRAVLAGDPEGVPEGAVGKPPLRRVLDTFLRVCEAVAYAHSRGVVHRDIKPENVMIGEFGEVLVMDWGLARRFGDVVVERSGVFSTPPPADDDETRFTMPGEVMGTPAYMPPEQARGDARLLCPATDVYALGAVLYELLMGRPPFQGPLPAVWPRIVKGSTEHLQALTRLDVPSELAVICARAMAPEPDERFPDAGALAGEIRGWLDGATRRERALAIVEEARATRPRIEALRSSARALRDEARGVLGALRSFDPVADKARGWRLEDDAERLERDASIEEVGWLQALRSALNVAPDLAEAHEALAVHYHGQLLAAEAARDGNAAARYEVLLRLHDRGRFAAVLAGEGSLSLVTDPEDAEVRLCRYVERDRTLVPEPVRDLGRTPLRDVTLPRGSYLLEIRAPGREPVRYPVLVARGETWDGVRPGGSGPHPIRLPAAGEIEADAVYVPAGWFWSGGDPDAGESLPRRRLWVDGLVVQRHPITNAQYLAFLNALLAGGREAEAIAACPRVGLGRTGPGQDGLCYARDAAGRFCLGGAGGDAGDDLQWPVAFVDWRSAMRYAQWYAETTGKPWRLLNELEWEKAARGVDGRRMPWGDYVEPTWAGMLTSHAGVQGRVPVDAYPTDVSPYGVRGMAGNVRTWCINVWKPDGPVVENGLVRLDRAADEDPELRAVRGGAWTATPALCRTAGRFVGKPERFGGLGFRLARPLEPL